jgi:hypothetical protein
VTLPLPSVLNAHNVTQLFKKCICFHYQVKMHLLGLLESGMRNGAYTLVRFKCDNRPPGSEKALRHIPAAAHCASQPLGNWPTPRTNLQQETQTALSRRPDH